MRRRELLAAALGLTAHATAEAGGFDYDPSEAQSAIREALTLGVQRTTTRLGRADGFFADPRVHIPLPGAMRQAQRALRQIGSAAPLDDLELRMNRGAEAAMPAARTVFVTAIRSVTISDAIGIVRGGDDSATQYLRGRTEPQLTRQLTPPMSRSLAAAGVFGQLNTAARAIGMGGGSSGLRDQVVAFAVDRALDGVFAYLAEEERAIRRDPVRRSTLLLRRVFG